MKIKYFELTCAGCSNIARFTGDHIFSLHPYWFTIRTEGGRSSSDRPSFNTAVCSVECFEKSVAVIKKLVEECERLFSNQRELTVRICDHCGTFEKTDKLAPKCGNDPFEGWTSMSTSESKKDFCCPECRSSHIAQPETSLFGNLKIVEISARLRLIEAINSVDFKAQIISWRDAPKKELF